MFFFKKWRFFHRLFLCKMDKEKVFSEVLEKKAFLDYKNIGSKNPPNLPFFTGVIVQKMNEKPNQPMKKKVSAIRLY